MRQHGYGNAIVPEVAAMFLISLMDSIEKMQVANDLRRGFGSRIDL
jgi:hypothetical protein